VDWEIKKNARMRRCGNGKKDKTALKIEMN
jgi:hypothetical protein